MLKRLWMAALLAAVAAVHADAIAKDKEKDKDKGKVDVALVAPANGSSYTAPAAITLSASAVSSQESHPVVQVQFFQGTTLLGTATQAPYTVTWSSVVAGNYVLTATAVNDKGDSATSQAVGINVNAPPSVSVTAPASNASYTGPAHVALAAAAADSDGTIAKVEFFNGNALLGSVTSAPYVFDWSNVAPGNYTIAARATDNQGAATLSTAVGINVNAVPTVSLSAPANNASYTAPAGIVLGANAADSDGTVTKVEFFNGATLLGTAASAPYTFNWSNVAAGNYTLTARVTDNQGAAATSAAVSINVNAPPAVSLTAPANNASYNAPASIVLTANAADSDGGIAKVEFYQGVTLLGIATSAPYSFTWTGAVAGNYTITARAADNQGAVTTSAAIAVNVNALPTVSLTAPLNNASFTGPANITLAANAADSDGMIAKVEFFNGSIAIGSATGAPYTLNWANVLPGNYIITAVATDNRGASTTSVPLSINVNAAPTVSLTAPANNASYNAPASIVLTANAADSDGGIARVEFFHGTTLLGSATGAPYSFTWTNVAAGNYTLTAKAVDNQGATASSAAITVNVNALPTVSLTAPANNTVITGPATITLTANAADSDGSIARVEFFHGTTLLGAAKSAPYSFTWTSVASGTYTLTAKATDNQGAVSTSAAIAVIVNAPPTVSLTAPANNASYISPAAIALTAAAGDSDGSIAKVEFYQGDTLLGTATGAPYSVSWTHAAPGNYTLTARATDNQGATAVSSPVAITVVANQLPTVNITVPAQNQTFIAPASLIIDATAGDTDGTIAKVEFYQGATLLATLADAPYTYHWTKLAAGSYAITAKATDNLGGVTTSAAVSITVQDNKLPAVSVTASPANATAPATVKLEAAAADADGSIVKVEFFHGATLLGAAGQAPYRFSWTNVAAGEYAVTAQATDDLGGTTVSDVVTVKVTNNVTQVYYIHPDHLNSPRLITDQNNNVVWEWKNDDPFGNNTPASQGFEFNLRFPGQYFDRETNLHYNYFRDYDPSTGRYVQSDPIGLAAGPNTYIYGDANPVSKTDPLGLSTYQCIRGLGQKPGGYVSPGNATHHQYSCVTLPNGTSICGGQGPSGNPISSPGKPTTPDEDYFDKNSCKKTQDDNQCFEQCLQDEWSKPRPHYSVVPGLGTQCQQYDDDVNTTCRKKCGLK